MKEDFTFKNLGILFTFYSIVYVYMYFGFYGINIFYYTDLQGVLTLFLSNMIKILIFSSIALLIYPLLSEKSKATDRKVFYNISLRHTLYILVISLVIFIIIFAVVLSKMKVHFQPITFLLITIIIHSLDRLEKFIYTKVKIPASKIMNYFCIFLAMPYFICVAISLEILFFPKLDHISFVYGYTTIKSGEKTNLYFIGKTSDNIFLHDKINKQTYIYNINDITDLKIYDISLPSLVILKD